VSTPIDHADPVSRPALQDQVGNGERVSPLPPGRELDMPAAHHRAHARYDADRRAYMQAERAWSQRRARLAELLEAAEHETGSVPSHFVAAKLRRDERVLSAVSGVLLERRTRQGETSTVVAGEGTIVVTDHRVLFDGAKNREWAFNKLQEIHHVGDDATLMRVTNRQTVSGRVQGRRLTYPPHDRRCRRRPARRAAPGR
jgi:hypothetical protein